MRNGKEEKEVCEGRNEGMEQRGSEGDSERETKGKPG